MTVSRLRFASLASALVFALFLGPRAEAQQSYILTEETDYISGCVGLCLCPTFLFPDASGAFDLVPAGTDGNFDVYMVTDFEATIGEGSNAFVIPAEGMFRIDLTQQPPMQQLDLELNVDGQLIATSSGLVEVVEAFPTISVNTTFDNNCRIWGFALHAEAFDPQATFIRGDADGNGSVSGLVDGLFMLLFQFGGGTPPPCLAAADASGDNGFSGLLDALYVLNFAFVPNSPPPPAPYPTCGLGSTLLGCDTPLVCP